MKFEFKPVTPNDYELLHTWLNRKHVAKNWNGPQSFDEVKTKYDKKRSSHFVFPYMVYLNNEPIGYIQSYQADLVGHGWWENEPHGTWGVDQFIGEENFIGKGLGPLFLKQFTDKLLTQPEVNRIITDPSPSNTSAIRAYEKAGFKKVGIQDTPDGPAMIMEIDTLSNSLQPSLLENMDIIKRDKETNNLIRNARIEEAEFLSDLTMRSKAYWGFDSDFLERCRPHLKIDQDYISSWPIIVMESDQKIIGYFSLKIINGEPRLDNLWIEPNSIRKGYGSILFDKAIATAKEMGWSYFRMAVDHFALGFYTSKGAKEIGVVPSRLGENIYLIHMEMQF